MPANLPSADHTLLSTEVRQGSILWLPPYDEVSSTWTSTESGRPQPVTNAVSGGRAQPKMFGHPIVVISRRASDPDTIHFLVVSDHNRRLTWCQTDSRR